MNRSCGRLLLALTAAALLPAVLSAWAGEATGPKSPVAKSAGTSTQDKKPGKSKVDPAKRSLELRAILHHDPTLGAPLERLVAIYRQAGKLDELTATYRRHLKKYPADVRALTVLVRILHAVGDPDAPRLGQRAVLFHPENPYLRFLLYRVLRARRDRGALAELDKAIELEKRPGRRRAWIKLLLGDAVAQERRGLARRHLKTYARLSARTPRSRLGVARAMNRFKFHSMALEQLEVAIKSAPSPELGVEIQMTAAEAEIGLGLRATAAERLDRLLSRVTADYWRRPQIMALRVALVRTRRERKAILKEARKTVKARPRDEAAVLNLARLLVSFRRRYDALEMLRAAGQRLPASEKIDAAILGSFDALHDDAGREKYLAERMRKLPRRRDIAFKHVKALMLVDRSREALAELDALMGELPAGARLVRLLQTARFLRAADLQTEAAAVFRRAVKLAPGRSDILRELAETYVAAGMRRRAREALAGLTVKQAATENLLDVAQFMVREEMFAEAARILRARGAADGANLDVRLLLLRAEAGLGNRKTARKIILESRVLAEGGARYRRWLEAAVGFHDRRGSSARFLAAEQKRLDVELKDGKWTESRLERLSAFAETSIDDNQRGQTIAMLRRYIAGKPPRGARIRMLKSLVSLLAQDNNRVVEVEGVLAALIVEDRLHADEHRALLALFHAGQKHLPKALPILDQIEISALKRPELLRRLGALYTRVGKVDRALRITRRLTRLQPGDKGNWEDLVNALAEKRDEPGLRVALRRLSAGPGRMNLGAYARNKLDDYVADSCWRSAVALLQKGDRDSLEKALDLLESVGAGPQDLERRLWVTLGRGIVLDRLGRGKRRDVCAGELRKLIAEELGGEEAREHFIAFPDGVAVSSRHALAALGARGARGADIAAASVTKRRGPLPGMRVKWAFEVDDRQEVTALLTLKTRTLVRDAGGAFYCLDRASGKLLWKKELSGDAPVRRAAALSSSRRATMRYLIAAHARSSLRPVVVHGGSGYAVSGGGRFARSIGSRYGRPSVVIPELPAPLDAGGDRFLLPGASSVSCYSALDGKLLWRSRLSPGKKTLGYCPPVSVFLRGQQVLAFDPRSCSLSALSARGGKLLWEKRFNLGGEKNPHGGGASLGGGHILVYRGKQALLASVETGRAENRFDPKGLRKFPLNLDGFGDWSSWWSDPDGSGTSSYAFTPPSPQYRNHLEAGRGLAKDKQLLTSGTVLAAPTAVWAARQHRNSARLGRLHRGYLVLCGDSGMSIIRTDLPVGGKSVPVQGTLVGFSGRSACVLGANALICVDLETGKCSSLTLTEVSGGRADACLDAAIDGPVIYVTGPRGILCADVAGAKKIFNAPWPSSVVNGNAAPVVSSKAYSWRGMIGGGLNCRRTIGSVIDGVLYARLSDSRVAAFTGRN
jgi:tetratricopeptide (TPR) repeat protein